MHQPTGSSLVSVLPLLPPGRRQDRFGDVGCVLSDGEWEERCGESNEVLLPCKSPFFPHLETDLGARRRASKAKGRRAIRASNSRAGQSQFLPATDQKIRLGMLENAIGALTLEVQKLREAIERQTLVVERLACSALSSESEQDLSGALIGEHQVAELLKLSVATVRRWRLLRTGPPFKKIGSAVRYSRTEVIEWMDQQPSTLE